MAQATAAVSIGLALRRRHPAKATSLWTRPSTEEIRHGRGALQKSRIRFGHGRALPGGDAMKYIFLLVPCVLAVLTPLYNRIDPVLFDLPFFYWYLLVLVPVSSLFVYLAWKVESR